jgi:hypothetical protein
MIVYTKRIVFPTSVKCLLLFLLITIMAPVITYAQEAREEAPPLKERIFYGGSFSLQLGSVTNIEVSPIIGIWVLPRVNFAIGPNYRYYKDYYGKTNLYGGRAYVQLVFFKDLDKFIPMGTHTSLFLHFEDEMLSLESSYWKNVSYDPQRFMINTLLAGGGISQQIGARAALNIMVLWALNDPGYEIYGKPEIRIGFVF